MVILLIILGVLCFAGIVIWANNPSYRSIQNDNCYSEIDTGRGKVKSFFIAASVLLSVSLASGVGVGLAFRCSPYTLFICVVVISPLVLFTLCGWATHKRLYRGAKAGMPIWPLLKYAVQSDDYRDFGGSEPDEDDDTWWYYRDK